MCITLARTSKRIKHNQPYHSWINKMQMLYKRVQNTVFHRIYYWWSCGPSSEETALFLKYVALLEEPRTWAFRCLKNGVAIVQLSEEGTRREGKSKSLYLELIVEKYLSKASWLLSTSVEQSVTAADLERASHPMKHRHGHWSHIRSWTVKYRLLNASLSLCQSCNIK